MTPSEGGATNGQRLRSKTHPAKCEIISIKHTNWCLSGIHDDEKSLCNNAVNTQRDGLVEVAWLIYPKPDDQWLNMSAFPCFHAFTARYVDASAACLWAEGRRWKEHGIKHGLWQAESKADNGRANKRHKLLIVEGLMYYTLGLHLFWLPVSQHVTEGKRKEQFLTCWFVFLCATLANINTSPTLTADHCLSVSASHQQANTVNQGRLKNTFQSDDS